jgi:hypothetical protein
MWIGRRACDKARSRHLCEVVALAAGVVFPLRDAVWEGANRVVDSIIECNERLRVASPDSVVKWL